MRTHQQIDERSLAMVRAIVEKIDHDPEKSGLARARATCERWYRVRPSPAIKEWLQILDRSWEQIREVLLDPSQEGQRLRQSDPFCGILTPQERWKIYREHSEAL
jgi:hypothetical protein